AGHIWKSKGIANNIFAGGLNVKRSSGRSRQTSAEKVKTSLTEISTKTRIEDRNRWRGAVETEVLYEL
ncbi:Hypothetical protein CINCED_3A005938, partial [Cinara cedri]